LQASSVHAFWSLQTKDGVPTHAPFTQESVVHALPSEHAFALLLVNTQPVPELHVSVVHGLLSLQTSGEPGWQDPPAHTSPVVQAFPSEHDAVLFVKTHPVVELQVSVVQTLLSLQVTGVPARHVPLRQASPVVHALPSEQLPVLLVNTQPVAGLQLSVVQGLLSSQTTGVPGWHVPPLHMSPVVQAFPSEQETVLLVNTHPVAVLQVSVVHGLLSLHVNGVPTQAPATQASVVQALPSEQLFALLGVKTHCPVVRLQTSSVQGLKSLQWTRAQMSLADANDLLEEVNATAKHTNIQKAGRHLATDRTVISPAPGQHTTKGPSLPLFLAGANALDRSSWFS
jgi:hypothetical protein